MQDEVDHTYISHIYHNMFVYISTLSSHLLPPNLAQQKKTMTGHPHSIHLQTKIQTFNIMISGPQQPNHPPSPSHLTLGRPASPDFDTSNVWGRRHAAHVARQESCWTPARREAKARHPAAGLPYLPTRLDDVTAIPVERWGPF